MVWVLQSLRHSVSIYKLSLSLLSKKGQSTYSNMQQAPNSFVVTRATVSHGYSIHSRSSKNWVLRKSNSTSINSISFQRVKFYSLTGIAASTTRVGFRQEMMNSRRSTLWLVAFLNKWGNKKHLIQEELITFNCQYSVQHAYLVSHFLGSINSNLMLISVSYDTQLPFIR